MSQELVTLTKLENAIVEGQPVETEIPRIKRLIAQWERENTDVLCRATSIRYGKALRVFLDFFPEKTDLSEFTRLDALEFKARRRRNGASARTTNFELGVAKRFWDWLMVRDEALFNPIVDRDKRTGKEGVGRLKEPRVAREGLSVEAQGRLYRACLDDRERLLVGLALSTGVRPDTLAQLERKDFDFDQKHVTIPPEKLKTNRSLQLPIKNRELELIAKLPEGRLFGKWIRDARAASYRWNKICMRIGIDLRGMKTARRSVATTLIRSGAPLDMVRQWLGHANIATTLMYCTPASMPEMRELLEKLS